MTLFLSLAFLSFLLYLILSWTNTYETLRKGQAVLLVKPLWEVHLSLALLGGITLMYFTYLQFLGSPALAGSFLYFFLFLLLWNSLLLYARCSGLIIRYEALLLLLLLLPGVLCVYVADNFLLFYLAIEYIAIIFLALLGYRDGVNQKFAIFTIISASFMLLSIVLFYNEVGSFYFEDLRLFILYGDNSQPGLQLAILFLLLSLLLKLGAAPFHQFLLDVYESSSALGFIMLLFLSKVIYLAILLKLLVEVIYPVWWSGSLLLLLSGFGSMVLGLAGIISQRGLKTLFAYNSLLFTGFCLVIIATALPLALTSLYLYVIVYHLFFVLLALFLHRVEPDWIFSDLSCLKSGLARRPVPTLLLSLCLFGLVGLPPFLTFTLKLVFFAEILLQQQYFLGLSLILFNLLNMFLYLRLLHQLFEVRPAEVTNLWVQVKWPFLSTVTFLLLNLLPLAHYDFTLERLVNLSYLLFPL